MTAQSNAQNLAHNIKHLVELALGHKINVQPNIKDLHIVDVLTTADELTSIQHYLNNAHLVNDQLIKDLVGMQLKRYPLTTSINLPAATSWDAYVLKLDKILAQVVYRKANNYEYQKIMPTQQQLFALQQECWQLTEQWYGAGKGNLSCFYDYYIAMSQAAGVTCFAYNKIGKFISKDHCISLINRLQRSEWFIAHENNYKAFVNQGGMRAHGRSPIDATAISNILYYKTAQLLFNYEFAKQLVVAALDLEDYGQLPYAQRVRLWHLLQQHYPDNTAADAASIYYKFVEFVNVRPGEYFNYFAEELPEANQVSQQLFHDIMKVAGLQSNYLVLLSRNGVDNWLPKRQFNLEWQRKYPLIQVNDQHNTITVRPAGVHELVRFLPNELPYAPGHGLSLCGDGLVHANQDPTSAQYEWNTPTDPNVECDNWARDIEKLFREFKFFCPQFKHKKLLPGERSISMFHNPMAYSTIHTTQHTHLFTTAMDKYLIYNLPANKTHVMSNLNVDLEVVQVGGNNDALYLRFVFAELENEALIQFLLQLNQAMFQHFGGIKQLDVHLQLFAKDDGSFAFIYEPHAFLMQLDFDRFLNPHNNVIMPRRPQFVQPEGGQIDLLTGEMATGLEYVRKFYDDTCKPGVHKLITEFIQQNSH